MPEETSIYVDDSPIHGKGLFARTDIPSGAVIGIVRGVPATEDGEHVLWTDADRGLLVQCNMRYINHSATPNAAYYDSLEVMALRDIRAGEEITHDYGAGWVE